jgi:hypothetical protein
MFAISMQLVVHGLILPPPCEHKERTAASRQNRPFDIYQFAGAGSACGYRDGDTLPPFHWARPNWKLAASCCWRVQQGRAKTRIYLPCDDLVDSVMSFLRLTVTRGMPRLRLVPRF